jgi:diadenosine tetraphosphate (Ap4A) HIT family hydrolase
VADCSYCSASQEDAWVWSEFVVALPHPEPLTACHMVVAPRRHVATFYELDVQEQRMIWDVIKQLSDRIASHIEVEGFDAGFADVPPGTERTAFHAYVHLLPRIPGASRKLPPNTEWVNLGARP